MRLPARCRRLKRFGALDSDLQRPAARRRIRVFYWLRPARQAHAALPARRRSGTRRRSGARGSHPPGEQRARGPRGPGPLDRGRRCARPGARGDRGRDDEQLGVARPRCGAPGRGGPPRACGTREGGRYPRELASRTTPPTSSAAGFTVAPVSGTSAGTPAYAPMRPDPRTRRAPRRGPDRARRARPLGPVHLTAPRFAGTAPPGRCRRG